MIAGKLSSTWMFCLRFLLSTTPAENIMSGHTLHFANYMQWKPTFPRSFYKEALLWSLCSQRSPLGKRGIARVEQEKGNLAILRRGARGTNETTLLQCVLKRGRENCMICLRNWNRDPQAARCLLGGFFVLGFL